MAELSGIEIIPLTREIGEALRRTYVNNVFSIGDNQIVRFRHPEGADRLLVLSPSHGAWVSDRIESRSETTEFTSKLRSEIERLRFTGAGQVDLDRVYDLTMGEGESLRHVILELMPPGNLVVTDGSGKVVLALREGRTGKRRLRRGERYAPPPQNRLSPAEVAGDSLREAMRREKTLGGALGRQVALPRKYVREVLGRVGLEESSPAGEASAEADRIAGEILGIVGEARSTPSPCLAGPPDAQELFAIAPESFEVTKTAQTMSSLCDQVFVEPMLKEVTEQATPEDRWRRETEVTINRLREQEGALIEKAKRLRAAAERARSSPSLEEALQILAGEAAESRTRIPPRSVEAVASTLFSLAKEADAKAGEARDAAGVLSRRTPPKETTGKKKTSKLSTRRGEWYERFRWFTTSEGKLAIGGRDAQSNTLLVRRHLEDGDSVYHADIFGSPFFILKRGTEQTPDETLEVAQATVAFSSAWKTGLASADAYWVTKEQVGTSAPSGEYLSRGSFMIRGKKNMMSRNLVQLALGLDGSGRVVAGPEAAIAASCQSYVVLEPHREKASETAKKVAHELKRLGGGERGPSVDDVLRALPAGGGKIVRTKTRRLEDKPK
ncbi:MAG TPA: NFACT family protein [Nitrososphaerales archaeon]|nr:NFACT family protein [Nitrososphaerales archaeon]